MATTTHEIDQKNTKEAGEVIKYQPLYVYTP